MRYNAVHIDKISEVIDNHLVKNQRGRYVKIDELLEELRSIENEIVVDVSPNCLNAAINYIEAYLSKGGSSFVPTLADVAKVILISRPTLNEWNYAGIVDIRKRRAETTKEKAMLKQRSSGYDIADLLAQLKNYANNLDLYK